MSLPNKQTAILIHQFLETLGLTWRNITLALGVEWPGAGAVPPPVIAIRSLVAGFFALGQEQVFYIFFRDHIQLQRFFEVQCRVLLASLVASQGIAGIAHGLVLVAGTFQGQIRDTDATERDKRG